MRRQAGKRAPSRRRGLGLTLIGAICCGTLALAIVTSALARPGERSGAAEWQRPSSQWQQPPSHEHGHGGWAGGSSPQAGEAQSGGGSASRQGEYAGGHAGGYAGGHTGGWGSHGGGEAGRGSWHGQGGGEQGSGQPAASPEAQSDHGDGADWQGATQQSGGTPQAQSPASAQPTDDAAKSSASPASSPASTPSAAGNASSGSPAPASAPTPPAPAGAASGSSRAVGGGALRHRVSRHRASRSRKATRRRVGKRTDAAGAHQTSAVKAAAEAATGSAGAAAPHRTAARDRRRQQNAGGSQQSHLPPVVRTITRIVSVVPSPLRVVIAALAALALALAARSRIAARATRRLEQQRRALLQDVGLLQAALLPRSPQRLGPVGASTAYRPANGPAAGGDFYDLFVLEDGRLAAIVGDISGHGRQALPHTALTRFTLRAYLEAGFSPRQALQTAGAALERQLGDSFATVAIATYQPRERRLTYACAGHPPPLVLGSTPYGAVTAASAPPIGAGMRTGTRQTVISLPGAATICLHTDGVTEARVGSQLYGAPRLTRALDELGPDASASDLLDRVAAQTDAQPDDMAACLLRLSGGEQPPRTLLEELQLDAAQAGSARTEQFLLACGVAAAQVPAVVSAARAEALRGGSALLEVRAREGAAGPEARVRPDNVAAIDDVKVRREMAGTR